MMNIVEHLAKVVRTLGAALRGPRRLITIVFVRRAKRLGEGKAYIHFQIVAERIVEP